MTRSLAAIVAILGGLTSVNGFAPATGRQTVSSTELGFGLPSFGSKGDDESDDKNVEKKSIGLQGLVQLITAGAGSPFLGEFQVCHYTALVKSRFCSLRLKHSALYH